MADIADVLVSLMGGGLGAGPAASSFTPPAVGGPLNFDLPAVGGGFNFTLPAVGGEYLNFGLGAVTKPREPGPDQKPERGQQAAQRPSRTSSGIVPASVPAEYQGMIQEVAAKYGVDPTLLAAQIKQESGFNPNARSPAGAQGIAQFMPATAQQYGVNPSDPRSSIDGMGRYMRDLLRQYNGNQREALAAYNGGDGAVQRLRAGTPYQETQQYLSTVTRNQEAYRAESAAMAGQAAAAAQPAGALRGVNQNVYAAQVGLPSNVAAAICGPAAVDAFVRVMGRNPGPAEAFQLARDQGLWDLQSGAHGPDSMVRLIGLLGGTARTATPDPGLAAQEIQAGRMVIIDTPKHYFQITDYNPATQQFQFGDAVGGNRWARLNEIGQWNFGSPRTMIVAAGQ